MQGYPCCIVWCLPLLSLLSVFPVPLPFQCVSVSAFLQALFGGIWLRH